MRISNDQDLDPDDITIAHPKGRKRWNGGGKPGVWTHAVVQNRSGHRGDRLHTAQKPIELMLGLVADFTDPGDTILDCYAGSGTTGVAAVRLGRHFVGVEQKGPGSKEDYVAIARERLAAEASGNTLMGARAGQRTMFERSSP